MVQRQAGFPRILEECCLVRLASNSYTAFWAAEGEEGLVRVLRLEEAVENHFPDRFRVVASFSAVSAGLLSSAVR